MENYTNSLQHHGIRGMKWGVRRYRNKDGTLTDKGRKRQIQQYKNKQFKKAKILNDEKFEVSNKKNYAAASYAFDLLRPKHFFIPSSRTKKMLKAYRHADKMSTQRSNRYASEKTIAKYGEDAADSISIVPGALETAANGLSLYGNVKVQAIRDT